jgi:hypothetical protein
MASAISLPGFTLTPTSTRIHLTEQAVMAINDRQTMAIENNSLPRGSLAGVRHTTPAIGN